MEIQARRDGSDEGLLGHERVAGPVPRGLKRKSLRSEARRRRILANVFFVCSSVVALAVVGICYALLRQ